MLVDPVERAADHILRVVAEFLVDGYRRIAREFGALGAHPMVVPEVLGVHLVVGEMVERTQQHAAPGVEGHASGEVRMADDELRDRAHFRLGRGKRPASELLEFLTPVCRKISI